MNAPFYKLTRHDFAITDCKFDLPIEDGAEFTVYEDDKGVVHVVVRDCYIISKKKAEELGLL